MIFVPKWKKRNNQRKIDKSFKKLLVTINRMNKIKAEKVLALKNTKPGEPKAGEALLNAAKTKKFGVWDSCFFAWSR